MNVGVLGLGEGRSLLSAIGTSENWHAVCICDMNEDLCRERADEFGIGSYTTEYSEMLARDDIDVIGIFTPDPMHADHIKMAMLAGKDVICTKPLMTSLDQAGEILRLAEARGLKLVVGASSRFAPTTMRQKRDLLDGRLGRVLSCEAHYNNDKRLGGAGEWGRLGLKDWLFCGLAHPADLVYWHLGRISEVSGYALKSPAAEDLGLSGPDCFHFVMKSEDGAIGLVSGCFGTPDAHPLAEAVVACTVRGTKGSSTASLPDFNYYSNIDGAGLEHKNYSDQNDYYYRWGGSSYHAGEYQNCIEYYSKCLASSERHRPDLADGIYVTALLCAMERTLEQGIPVRVDDLLEENGLKELL